MSHLEVLIQKERQSNRREKALKDKEMAEMKDQNEQLINKIAILLANNEVKNTELQKLGSKEKENKNSQTNKEISTTLRLKKLIAEKNHFKN